MKKIFTSLFTLAAIASGYAQTIHIWEGGVDHTGDTIVVSITASSLNATELELHNTSSSALQYKVNRTILNPPIDADAMLYFCTGTQCYSPNSSTTWTPSNPAEVLGANATLPNGPGTYGISAHFDAGAACNDLFVLYRVYNVQTGSNDTAYVTLNYKCTTGINDSDEAATLSSAYPNPASSLVSMKYDITNSNSGRIVIYDMLGKTVKEVALTDKQGIARINVADLNAGVYFYALIVNDKAITTKKLIVNSK